MSEEKQPRQSGDFVIRNHALPPVKIDASDWPRNEAPRTAGEFVIKNHALPPAPIGERTTPPPKTPLRIFCSYSHKDRKFEKELANYFVSVERQGLVTVWNENQIPAGSPWHEEIEKALNDSEIILLLVSADFLASEYCHQITKKALTREQTGEARIFLVKVPSKKGSPDSETGNRDEVVAARSEMREFLDSDRQIYATSFEAPSMP